MVNETTPEFICNTNMSNNNEFVVLQNGSEKKTMNVVVFEEKASLDNETNS